MPRHDPFSKSDYETYQGQIMLGRVADYDFMRGYGFILTECGHDIFVSTYDLGKLQYSLKLGVTVRFIPVERDGKYYATNVSVVKGMGRGVYQVTDNVAIPYKQINDFYIVPGRAAILKMDISEKELAEHGYSSKDLRHLVIKTVSGEVYLFTEKGSPVKADGQVESITKMYQDLEELFLRLF